MSPPKPHGCCEDGGQMHTWRLRHTEDTPARGFTSRHALQHCEPAKTHISYFNISTHSSLNILEGLEVLRQHHIIQTRSSSLKMPETTLGAGDGERRRERSAWVGGSYSVLTVIFPCWGKFTYFNWHGPPVCNSLHESLEDWEPSD